MDSKRLYRSRSNRIISGVCAGLGDYFGIDPTLVRVLFIILSVLGLVGQVVILYVILMFIVPEEPGPAYPGQGTGMVREPSQPPSDKVTDLSTGEPLETGAGGRSTHPAPEPSAGEEEI
jgi:phage shock protein C